MIDCCPPANLCPLHLQAMFMQLKGVAALRGELWAESVAAKMPALTSWPETEKMRSIAARKVEDLASDLELRRRLADELVRWAERWWRNR